MSGTALHQYGEVDLLDAVLSPAFVLATVVSTGVSTFTIFGFAFSESVISLSGGAITISTIVSLTALLVAYGSNQVNFDDFDGVETGVVAFGVASTLGLAIVPAYADFVAGSDVIGAAVVVVHSAAYYLLAYY